MTKLTELTSPKVESTGNVTILTFTADAIRNVENNIARELFIAQDRNGLDYGAEDNQLLLNFANVKSLNSLELGTLIGLHKQTHANGGQLTLFNLRPYILELFTICRLDSFLTISLEDLSTGKGTTSGT